MSTRATLARADKPGLHMIIKKTFAFAGLVASASVIKCSGSKISIDPNEYSASERSGVNTDGAVPILAAFEFDKTKQLQSLASCRLANDTTALEEFSTTVAKILKSTTELLNDFKLNGDKYAPLLYPRPKFECMCWHEFANEYAQLLIIRHELETISKLPRGPELAENALILSLAMYRVFLRQSYIDILQHIEDQYVSAILDLDARAETATMETNKEAILSLLRDSVRVYHTLLDNKVYFLKQPVEKSKIHIRKLDQHLITGYTLLHVAYASAAMLSPDWQRKQSNKSLVEINTANTLWPALVIGALGRLHEKRILWTRGTSLPEFVQFVEEIKEDAYGISKTMLPTQPVCLPIVSSEGPKCSAVVEVLLDTRICASTPLLKPIYDWARQRPKKSLDHVRSKKHKFRPVWSRNSDYDNGGDDDKVEDEKLVAACRDSVLFAPETETKPSTKNKRKRDRKKRKAAENKENLTTTTNPIADDSHNIAKGSDATAPPVNVQDNISSITTSITSLALDKYAKKQPLQPADPNRHQVKASYTQRASNVNLPKVTVEKNNHDAKLNNSHRDNAPAMANNHSGSSVQELDSYMIYDDELIGYFASVFDNQQKRMTMIMAQGCHQILDPYVELYLKKRNGGSSGGDGDVFSWREILWSINNPEYSKMIKQNPVRSNVKTFVACVHLVTFRNLLAHPVEFSYSQLIMDIATWRNKWSSSTTTKPSVRTNINPADWELNGLFQLATTNGSRRTYLQALGNTVSSTQSAMESIENYSGGGMVDVANVLFAALRLNMYCHSLLQNKENNLLLDELQRECALVREVRNLMAHPPREEASWPIVREYASILKQSAPKVEKFFSDILLQK